MKFPDPRTQTALLALLRSPELTFSVLPIRPLNPIGYTGLLLGLGHTRIYELIGSGVLDARKLGKQTRITGESIKALIDSLPKGVGDSQRAEDFRGAAGSRRLPKAAIKRQPGRRPEEETKPRPEEDSPGSV
jgi:hypothetical protein